MVEAGALFSRQIYIANVRRFQGFPLYIYGHYEIMFYIMFYYCFDSNVLRLSLRGLNLMWDYIC